MNNILKQALYIVLFIFLLGFCTHNKEITKVVNGGVGNIIMGAGIILAIGVFFPLNISVVDKFICFFWAGAMFFFGAGLHKAGFVIALMILTGYIVVITIYFSQIIEERTFKFLITLGVILFVVTWLLIPITAKCPNVSKILDAPTEKIVENDYYGVYAIYNHEEKTKDNPRPSMFGFRLGYTTGTLAQAQITANEMKLKWEENNSPKKLMEFRASEDILFSREATRP